MTINLGYGPMSGPHCIEVPDCEMCEGSGRVLIVGDAEPVAAEEDDPDAVECEDCGGRGYLPH